MGHSAQKAAIHGALTGRDDGGKWMQDVKEKKGALHKELGIPEGEKIPTAELEKDAQKGGKLGKRANLALRYRGK